MMTLTQIKEDLAAVNAELKRLMHMGLRDGRKARILEVQQWHLREELAKLM
jgi:Fe2+ transport system protein FeoA